MSRGARLTLALLGATLCTLAAALVLSPAARAMLTAPFLNRIDISPVSPCDIAVDNPNVIYAVHWNNSLHKFDSAGTDLGTIDPNSPTAVNVDPSTHHVFSDRGGSIAEYDAAGNFVKEFGSADLHGSRGVDVRASTGTVYATDNPSGQNSRVVMFDASTGNAIGSFNGADTPAGNLGHADKLAVRQSTGEIYVIDTNNGVVDIFDSSGVYQSQLTGFSFGGDPDLAVDNSGTSTEGYLYVKPEFGPLQVYDSSENFLFSMDGSQTPDGPFADSCGDAVDPTNGHIYVSSYTYQAIYEFDNTFVVVPDVTTGAATNVTKNSATLHGTINPDGVQVTDCHFEYGTTTAYELGSVPCAQTVGSGSSDVQVSANITGLATDTTYHFRLVGANANGTINGADQTFTTLPPILVATGAATNIQQTTATLNGSVNPLGVEVTDCHFEYGTDTSYGQNVPCAETVGSGTSAVSVHADITGLTPGTLYHYRLVASNAEGTRAGQDRTFRTLIPPTVVSASVPCVEADSALLVARVSAGFDPNATVHFEYGTTQSYGTSTPDQLIDPSGGNDPKTVFVELTGLAANTTYHFIVVAENAVGPASSTDQTFSTANLSPCGLPENRAYEQVSPPDKNGNDVQNDGSAAALLGNAASFDSLGCFANATGCGLINSYVSTRGSSGWSAQMVSPPIPPGALLASAIPLDYMPDLDKSIAQVGGLAGGAVPIYVRDSSGNFQLVSPGVVGTPTYDGSSSDAAHVVFEVGEALVPGAPAGVTNVYEFSGGQLHLVSILPGETPDPAGGTTDTKPRSVSTDGSKIFWSDGAKLYVRENGSATVQVDASQPNAAGPGGGGQFWTASPDGSRALFTDGADAGLTTDTQPASGTNLYRYDVDTGELTNLTPAADARVVGVLGASDDGNRVYFVAQGVLASGATADQNNLYVRDGGQTRFIATLGDNDTDNWSLHEGRKTSRLTPDGQTLLFSSRASQLGYDNAGFLELYRYHLGDPAPECVSCNPTGATGDATLAPSAGGLFGVQLPLTERRNLSHDGSRVFFTTPESLVGGDINDTNDVYEWKDGELFLISTGRGKLGAEFSNASASGDDVFFITREQLVSSDQDDDVDMYDARVGGGFPSTPPVVCVGEACKPPIPGAPTPPGTGSSTITGPGNQPKDTTPHAGKKKKKNCKKIKNKQKRKKCKKNKRRAH